MKLFTRFSATVLGLLVSGVTLLPASVPEPDTIFYGKVLHRDHGNEHQLTEGTLTWTLRDESGEDYTYTAELEDIEGVFSYRIAIPHQALASGLSVDPTVIPLGVGEARYDFVSIEVDGHPAAILWSAVDFVKLLQDSRAATYRIDLLVSFDLTDTDGDGMPDWWEQFYGLDWQTPDGNLDSDGDGWSDLNEYLGGTNPLRDDRAPTLLTTTVAAYGESENGVWLRSADADSTPADLEFTLTGLPAGGYLHFIPPSGSGGDPAVALGVGDTFTQEQLDEGVLAYRHTDPGVTETSFSVALSDGVNVPFEAEVAIDVFPPSASLVEAGDALGMPAWWRDENVVFEAYWGLRENMITGDLVESALLYLLGKNYGWTLWDERADTLPVTLAAEGAGSHFVLGGDGDDTLSGSAEDDILAGGPGTDRLGGGAGLDLFIVSDGGLEIIEDFDAAEDVLDLSDLAAGQSGVLNDYLLAVFGGTNTEIGVDQDGDGSGFTDAVIRLEGVALSQDDLHRLWSVGQLLLGSVQGMGSVTIEDWPAQPLEEGFSTAELTLHRNGPADLPLTVSLAISGSATNGVDYTTLPATVFFAAGQRTASLLIEPLPDGANEFSEVLNLDLASGADYVLGEVPSGQISIEDAKQRFSVYALQAAVVVGEGPGYLQIYRQGPRSGFVQLLLNLGGSGASNVDFTPIPTLVSFSDGQASLYLPVEALAGGSLAETESSETVSVSIRPAFGDEYLLGDSPSATVRLLSDREAFEAWAAAAIPEADPAASAAELAAMSSPRTGLNALLEYALSYGLDLNDGVDADERSRLEPQLQADENGFLFEFTRRLNDDGLDYIVECSADLNEWRSGPEYFEAVPVSEAEENAGVMRYRALDPGGEGRCFVRVRVSLSE